jgi:hypothetical protein
LAAVPRKAACQCHPALSLTCGSRAGQQGKQAAFDVLPLLIPSGLSVERRMVVARRREAYLYPPQGCGHQAGAHFISL